MKALDGQRWAGPHLQAAQNCAQAPCTARPICVHCGRRRISPLTLTLVFSEPSGRLQKIGPEFFLPSVHRRFGLCPCAPTLVSSSEPSSRCLPLGMSFSSLSFSPHLKFSYSEAFFFLFPPSIGLGLPDPSPLILLQPSHVNSLACTFHP